MATGRKAAAMAGAPVLASPGGGSTPEGMEPAPGQPGNMAPSTGANENGEPVQSGVMG